MLTSNLRISASERIILLRSRCLERKKELLQSWPEDPRLTAQSLRQTEHINSWIVRRGKLTRDRLAGLPLALDDLELLIGRTAPDRPEWQTERQEAIAFLSERYPNLYPPGQTGHCELDLSRLFELGIDGLMAAIQKRMEKTDGKTHDVYLSFAYALEGLSILAEHAAEVAEDACRLGSAPIACNTNAPRQIELSEMATVCRKIAHDPPETFRQALQLLWLAGFGAQWGDRIGLVNPGRLDRTLWPYYQADVAAGRLNREEALLYLESLYLLLNETIPDGLAISVMIGGRDAQGRDVTNELSFLCLEAVRRTNLIYPTVGVCWHSGTPEALTDLAIELIAQGYKQPAFFGDETIQRGLRGYGVPADESCNYINSTCVEITPCGSSNVWVASPYFSTCQILLDEVEHLAFAQTQIDAADSNGEIAMGTSPSFEDFLNGYRSRLAEHIAKAVQVNNEDRLARQKHGGKPLQSVFTRDCFERGLDIDDGGARYNWVECSFVGLANLVDSLHVIREEVFNTRRLDLAKLNQILKADYQGYEKERLRFLQTHPKYGNDCALVDSLMQSVMEFIREECVGTSVPRRHRIEPDGSPFVPGAFCWIMHEQLGRICGATPDGRKAGFPFADGCGAAQGRELNGPTAAVLSVTSWDAAALIGGAAFNMRFNKALFSSPDSLEKLKYLILTFLRNGGFETQVNVLDHRILIEAQNNPENYRDLIVRIGGYSDYFTRLSPQMQAEIILRTEYNQV